MRAFRRIPLLYIIGSVLVVVSVVPLYFYGSNVVAISRDRLKTNEMLLQNSITSSLADDLEQRHENLLAMMANLRSAIEITSGGNLSGEHVQAPELRALLEQFVSSSPDLAYVTLVNSEKKGIRAGRTRTEDDPFMQMELERAFTAAWDGRAYQGQPLRLGAGRDAHTVLLLSTPVLAAGRFVGMIGAFLDLDFLIRRLKQVSQGQLQAYVIDQQGRLVAGADSTFATGQEMTRFEIARNFVEQGQSKRLAATNEFQVSQGNKTIAMLGTYSPILSLDWAVVAQKPRDAAYATINEMQWTARWLAIAAALISLLVSIFAARKIATPLRTLTEQSHAIARGDFSQRVQVRSRTEIGELAQTFNHMTDDLERLVADLKRAADENLTLFLSSIQMLAGAVDEKDPYTRGHSDRVTKYSVALSTELGLAKEEIEKIRIAAQLHDVGKIGIEDRILKKPGALTPEEFEIMKTHTIKGANILRPVQQLREMLPGIELHHESLDGRGYPYGLKGDQIPLMPRIIMVADTFDAMTTKRPYQSPISYETAVRRIEAMANTRYDATVVKALVELFARNALGLERQVIATEYVPEVIPAEVQPV
jgi:HD-GYP domain-containing protein (c-di-GMP phosphodiesterase class II)